MNTKQKQKRVQFVIDYLRETEKFRYGICNDLVMDFNMCSLPDIVEEYAPLWDEYSGVRKFPVPPPKSYVVDRWSRQYLSPAHAAFRYLDKTTGEYGKSRKRLANFLADCIEEDMEYWIQ